MEAWKWLLELLHHLTPEGMSSDESETEGLQTVFRVKILPWRREKVAEYMHMIDVHYLKNRHLLEPQGAKPVPRLREGQQPISTRILKHLPASLYNDEWKKDRRRGIMLHVSEDDFAWMHVMVMTRD